VNWILELFGVEKPVVAMCHLKALPGDPQYDPSSGIEWIVQMARHDLRALQNGGVNAVMFSNESSRPYLTHVQPITSISMSRIIAELMTEIRVPFGINVLWDPVASIDVAVATGARFVREIFTGVYASDFGIWNTNCGEVIRHQYSVHGQDIRLFYNILPEAAVYLGERQLEDIARSTVFNSNPDALCVSGLTAGTETSLQALQRVKSAVPGTPVFANTGVRLENVEQQLSIVDGAIIGTAFKEDGNIWNQVDENRVRALMDKVKSLRLGKITHNMQSDQ
jgi:membrane complex biogenesis BtpA family protein